MSAAAAIPPPPALDMTSLVVYTWVMAGFAVLISAGRYGIRWWFKGKLLWDDLTHSVALTAFIGMLVAFQLLYPDTFFLTNVERGFGTPVTQQQALVIWARDKKYQYALVSMFLVSVWFVKLTFMLFYRQLFKINAVFMRVWWATLAFVLLSWVISFVLTILTSCGGNAGTMYDFFACNSPDGLARGLRHQDVMCALNIATDAAIMILPLWMLHTLKIRMGQKIGLAFIFSIGIVVIALDIVRNVKSVQATDFTEVAAYDIAEVCVAVIVSALPTYQALARSDRRPTKKSYYQDLKYGSGGKQSKGSSQGDTNPLSTDKSGSHIRSFNVDRDAYHMDNFRAVHETEHV